MIFSLFVLDLLGFGWNKVVRWSRGRGGVEMGCFVVGFVSDVEGEFG